MKEAQLQITHAQAMIDREWARRSMAKLPELDIDDIFLRT